MDRALIEQGGGGGGKAKDPEAEAVKVAVGAEGEVAVGVVQELAGGPLDTRVVKIDSRWLHEDGKEELKVALGEAAVMIKDGHLVAFPTETVYGLGANALSDSACRKIYAAKGRPSDNPLIVHIASLEMLSRVAASVPPRAETLIAKFWPGPLTLLFPKRDCVPTAVTAGLETVAVRWPKHPVAAQLILQSDCPIAAPSANRSGRPSPTTAEHVLTDLKGRVGCIIDGGSASFGVESTVLDVSRDPPVILRPGGVTKEQLREVIPDVIVYGQKIDEGQKGLDGAGGGSGFVRSKELEEKPPTPGLKYRHYSPNARVVLFELASETESTPKGIGSGSREMGAQVLQRVTDAVESEKLSVGLIHTHREIDIQRLRHLERHDVDGSASSGSSPSGEDQKRGLVVYNLGSEMVKDDEKQKAEFAEEVARGLFKALRGLDEMGVDVIFVEGISESHAGYAVMNRLRKAAGEIVPVVGL